MIDLMLNIFLSNVVKLLNKNKRSYKIFLALDHLETVKFMTLNDYEFMLVRLSVWITDKSWISKLVNKKYKKSNLKWRRYQKIMKSDYDFIFFGEGIRTIRLHLIEYLCDLFCIFDDKAQFHEFGLTPPHNFILFFNILLLIVRLLSNGSGNRIWSFNVVFGGRGIETVVLYLMVCFGG